MAPLPANGSHAEPAGQGSRSGFTEISGLPGLAQTPGVRSSGPLRRSQGIIPERIDRGAHAAPASAPALGPANGAGGAGPDELPRRRHDQPETAPGAGQAPNGAAGRPGRAGPPPGFDVFRPRWHDEPGGETPVPPDAAGLQRGAGEPRPGRAPAGPGPGPPVPGPGAHIPAPAA